MATVAVTSDVRISETPWKIRKLVVTTGATALNYTHGEDSSPDMMFSQLTGPVSGTVAASHLELSRSAATTVNIDAEDDGNDTHEVYLVWFGAGDDGGLGVT